jgi:hypothetical protein
MPVREKVFKRKLSPIPEGTEKAEEKAEEKGKAKASGNTQLIPTSPEGMSGAENKENDIISLASRIIKKIINMKIDEPETLGPIEPELKQIVSKHIKIVIEKLLKKAESSASAFFIFPTFQKLNFI